MKRSYTLGSTLILWLLWAGLAHAANVALVWSLPSEANAVLTGFKIYYGQTSHADVERPTGGPQEATPYDKYIYVSDPKATTAILQNFQSGVWYFRITAYYGVVGESDFFDEIEYEVVDLPKPGSFRPAGPDDFKTPPKAEK
jgi:hypothetical protein